MLATLIRRYRKDYTKVHECWTSIERLESLLNREVLAFWGDYHRVISEQRSHVLEREDLWLQIQKDITKQIALFNKLYRRLYWFDKHVEPELRRYSCRVTQIRVNVALNSFRVKDHVKSATKQKTKDCY